MESNVERFIIKCANDLCLQHMFLSNSSLVELQCRCTCVYLVFVVVSSELFLWNVAVNIVTNNYGAHDTTYVTPFFFKLKRNCEFLDPIFIIGTGIPVHHLYSSLNIYVLFGI